ncbi:MAG: helix-turn-helix domain-containing protein [Bacteroidetes bacterium]|nr:helix-turn-helix domain-containing protein [Bacteroidota bacterium]
MNNFYDEAEKVLKRIDEQVSLIVAKMKIDSKLDPEDIIFDNQEFLKVMNISKRTAQQWRDTGYIGFSQLGNKIYYRLSDIKALLNANYNPKK